MYTLLFLLSIVDVLVVGGIGGTYIIYLSILPLTASWHSDRSIYMHLYLYFICCIALILPFSNLDCYLALRLGHLVWPTII